MIPITLDTPMTIPMIPMIPMMTLDDTDDDPPDLLLDGHD